jgi:SAM-dependent methyltransferase
MLEVPQALRQTGHAHEETWLDSARRLVELVCRECGFDDLSDKDILDVGCGTKIAKVLLDDPIPVGRYVGIDVDRRIVDFLCANVHDPRFEFHHIDSRNEYYNRDGLPLADRTELPIGSSTFDVIWLFSVFTHLPPSDYVAMLRLLRPYVRPDGWLVFSLFINEFTDTGAGPLDNLAQRMTGQTRSPEEALTRAIDDRVAEKGQAWFDAELSKWLASLDEETRAAQLKQWRDDGSAAEKIRSGGITPSVPRYVDARGEVHYDGEAPDYVELVPDQPLLAPLFSRRHAIELIDETGWDIVTLNQPEPDYIQHYFVCRPS